MSEKKIEVTVPLEWNYSEGIITKYATNLIVQHTQHEFIISFFEVYSPPLIGTPEQQQKQASEIKSIKAECIARIVVSTERMPDFVKVLQDNLNQFIAKKNKTEKIQ